MPPSPQAQSAMSSIDGWLPLTDCELFELILSNQPQLGDLAELGVYHGLSAVVIGSHLRSAESFTVVDLFGGEAATKTNDDENSREYGNVSLARFEKNYRRILGTLPNIVQGYSSSIVEHTKSGQHRFVHIDASHLYGNVVDDIAAARYLLDDEGVVVFDDIRSPHTPGVAAAAWSAVADGLRPFAISEQKLYATWGEHRELYDLVLGWAVDRPHEVQEILGYPIVRLWDNPTGLYQWAPPALVPTARKVKKTLRTIRRSLAGRNISLQRHG